jgi:hypothetical protein
LVEVDGLEDGNLYLRLRKMSHTIYSAIEKSVTFTDACANEIIPSINRSFVYKSKEGGHVRIKYKSKMLLFFSQFDRKKTVLCIG